MSRTTRQKLNTSLRRRRSRRSPMEDYDALPAALRLWLSQAALQWAAKPVLKAWDQAMRDNAGCKRRAMAQMDKIEARLLARDALIVWGQGHPAADEGMVPDGSVATGSGETRKTPTP